MKPKEDDQANQIISNQNEKLLNQTIKSDNNSKKFILKTPIIM